jgi:hypothetical protein
MRAAAVTAYLAALVACVLAGGGPVTEDLAVLWHWYPTGHRLSGIASKPVDPPGDRNDRDLVYPRILHVY